MTHDERIELGDLLADPAVWVEPDPALEERIVAAITEHADAPTLYPLYPLPTRPSVRHRARRVRYAVLGAAAAVLLALGGAVVTRSHHRPPVQYAAALTSTALSPGASGHVTLTKTTSGWRIRLHATGLPRLDNGSYYEAWLKSSGGILVPVGTFNQATDVTLWAGVPPSGYPTLTVTRQQADGDPASSGQVVLVGSTRRAN